MSLSRIERNARESRQRDSRRYEADQFLNQAAERGVNVTPELRSRFYAEYLDGTFSLSVAWGRALVPSHR